MKEKKKMILARVQKEIQETAKKIEEYKELIKPIAPENAIGRVSRMDAINNKSVVEAALRESEKKLISLMTVEKQINKINFGVCVKCKIDIPFERIMFRPESRYCVNCAA